MLPCLSAEYHWIERFFYLYMILEKFIFITLLFHSKGDVENNYKPASDLNIFTPDLLSGFSNQNVNSCSVYEGT